MGRWIAPSWRPVVIDWYHRHARDLPWRRADASPWGVMVSEFMLQQTPVARVLQPWQQWLVRWPTPAALAAEPVGEAVRAWGQLGYPRRAQRLHAAATVITERHGGRVPSDPDELRALPGVGDYTAAAIASFAYGAAEVLDVNVRRVLARLDGGADAPWALRPRRSDGALPRGCRSGTRRCGRWRPWNSALRSAGRPGPTARPARSRRRAAGWRPDGHRARLVRGSCTQAPTAPHAGTCWRRCVRCRPAARPMPPRWWADGPIRPRRPPRCSLCCPTAWYAPTARYTL